MKPSNLTWKQKLDMEKAAKLEETGPSATDAGTSEPMEAHAPTSAPCVATKAVSMPRLRTVRLKTTQQILDKPVTSITMAHYFMTFMPDIRSVMCVSCDNPQLGYALVPFESIASMDFSLNEE